MSTESGIVLELRRSLARLEMALAEINEGLAITDAAGQLLWCNAAFERLVGRSRLVMLGQPLVTLLQNALGADPRLRLDRLLADQSGGGTVTTVLTREPLQVVDIRWRPVRQERPAPYVFTFHDVSDRVSLEELRRRSQELMDQQLALAEQVHTCPVTGLPNRRGLSVAIQDALEGLEHHSGWLAVLFCDLNRFKEVNDTYGHRVGDQLLIELAQRMKQVLRPKDVLARLGGDEFVMLCTDLAAPEDALQIAERLQQGVGQPWMPAQADAAFTIVPQVSVGISLASGGGMSADRLLHDADLAMYEAKRGGGRQIVVFDAQIAERLQRRLEIRRGLEEALRRQILPMHFQPVVSLGSGRVVGYEALVRPRDRQGGPIPPTEFIQVAESSGLIQPLGQLVVEQVLRSARDCGLLERGLGLAVNFAAQQLASRFLAEDLIAAARRYGCPPHLFTVEVTETALIDQPERTRNELTSLRAAGFRVMLDDFGVGYSSLTWLAELPIDGLKIDRSFTATMLEDRRRHALIAAVLQLARELELEVVAEGIETAAQEEALRSMGCGLGQGNRFSVPLSPAELLAGLAGLAA
ncbi:MAG: EAL domain-containing protein [Synechococcus sp.]|nr:EAL domain-containing protein [Synechococcus sp.]